MIKILTVAALFSSLISAVNHQTSAATARESAKSSAVIYPYIQNERFAVRAQRTLSSAQATYAATYGNGNYGSLNSLRQAGFIDAVLASGNKYGYYFAVQTVAGTAVTPASFFITATPQRYRKTGGKSFYIDTSGVMRGADKGGAPATVTDPIVENECLPNEECVILDLRTISGAQAAFQSTSATGNYGSLSQLYASGLIDERLASGRFHGYIFTCTNIARTNNNPASFKITAIPVSYGVTGIRSFYIDETGIIRGADKNGAPADADDPPI